jgi:hypothetical protein
MTDEEKINEIIDRVLEERDDDQYSKEPEVQRIAARTGAQTGKPEGKQTYEDWVKSQPKPVGIGVHKNKPKKK